MTTLRAKKNERGSAFISALIFSSLLFVTAASFLLMISSEYKLTDRSYRAAVAINLAEGGVDYAIQALESGDISNWSGTNPKTKTLNSMQTAGGKALGDVYVEIFDPQAQHPIIMSAGYVPDMAHPALLDRTVRVRLNPGAIVPFSAVFIGDEHLKVAGSDITDSYDSRLGEYGGENVGSNGDVLTNGNTPGAMEILGAVLINGDAATGPGGTVTGGGTITGTITADCAMELQPPEVPPSLANLGYWEDTGLLSLTGNSTYTLDPGDHKFRRIKLAGNNVKLTINGPAQIYLTGYQGKSIFQTGGEIACNGDVVFYVDDRVKLSGNGITNSSLIPQECLIFGTASCVDVDISGTAALYGAIYTPKADIHLRGNSDGFGAFVGKTLACTGNGNYHYDEALSELEITASGYSVDHWQEKE